MNFIKKNINLNKKKLLLNITEILIGSESTKGISTMGLINPGVVIIISIIKMGNN